MKLKSNADRVMFSCICAGIVLGIFFMSSFRVKNKDFENAALGHMTKTYYATDENGNLIHYSPKFSLDEFTGNISPYLSNTTILYLGNSQSHSINQMKENDNTMSGYLFNELSKRRITFITASMPNANLQEHYLMYCLLDSLLPNLDMLVLPVFMDDLRETGIRKSYFSAFSTFRIKEENELSADINTQLASFEEGIKADTNIAEIEGDYAALQETMQDVFERNLNSILYKHFRFWSNRENIRGAYFTFLYQLRNTLLNISSQSTRRIIPARYRKNLLALDLIVEKASKAGVKVFILVPPLRKDIRYPYEPIEYSNFKTYLSEYTKKHRLEYLDIDGIIPGEYWGVSAPTQLFKELDYDFMHFQSIGHRILADTLERYLLKKL